MNKQTDFEKVYTLLTGKTESLESLKKMAVENKQIDEDYEFGVDEDTYSISGIFDVEYYNAFDFDDTGECTFATMGGGEASGYFDLNDNTIHLSYSTEELIKAMKYVNAKMILTKDTDFYEIEVETLDSVDTTDFVLDVELLLDKDRMIEAIKEHEKKIEDREVLVKEIMNYFDDGMINSYNINDKSSSFVDIDEDKNYDERLFTQLKELQEIYHLFADDKLEELEDAYTSDYPYFIDDACIYLAEALTNL